MSADFQQCCWITILKPWVGDFGSCYCGLFENRCHEQGCDEKLRVEHTYARATVEKTVVGVHSMTKVTTINELAMNLPLTWFL